MLDPTEKDNSVEDTYVVKRRGVPNRYAKKGRIRSGRKKGTGLNSKVEAYGVAQREEDHHQLKRGGAVECAVWGGDALFWENPGREKGRERILMASKRGHPIQQCLNSKGIH